MCIASYSYLESDTKQISKQTKHLQSVLMIVYLHATLTIPIYQLNLAIATSYPESYEYCFLTKRLLWKGKGTRMTRQKVLRNGRGLFR